MKLEVGSVILEVIIIWQFYKMNKYIQQIVNKYSFIYKPSSTNFRLKFIESNRAVKKSRPPPKMSGNFRQSDYG